MFYPRVLITGGAGFIGSNAALHHMRQGSEVIVFDNLCRPGSKLNLEWLRQNGPVQFIQGDVRDAPRLTDVFKTQQVDLVLHLAAQVAVTTSCEDPRTDFEVNAAGTLNLLEAVRLSGTHPIVIYASTNKVYGGLDHIGVAERERSYEFSDLPYGVDESVSLDFHSPYGCSKGSADQYAIDYARIYGLKTVVFRQSCIYGPRQFGIEDQGWVAHFLISAAAGRELTIYGTGKQVRDLLYVDDLLRAYDLAADAIDVTKGQAYNIGGGPANAVSLLDAIDRIGRLMNQPLRVRRGATRPGDQPVFVADTRKAERDFGWTPAWSVDDGLERLFKWVVANFADQQAVAGKAGSE